MKNVNGIHNLSGNGRVSSELAKGAAASAGALAGKSLLGKLKSHPLLVLGAGIAVGFYAHKYRKEIISAASDVVGKGKDFILQQKESLEDIVAENKPDDEPQA